MSFAEKFDYAFQDKDPCLIASWSQIEKEECKALIEISEIQKKKEGIFFTSPKLSELAASRLQNSVPNKRYLDPACGTGNLLCEVVKGFDAKESLEDTLIYWNQYIYGLDINPSFIAIARKKIIRIAYEKGSKPRNIFPKNLENLLTNIKVGNFVEEYESYIGEIDNVIMNPPYCYMPMPSAIEWSSGKVNAAAVFLYLGTKLLSQAGQLVAILPDVIRSGTRYSKLRELLKSDMTISSESYGAFSVNVDVDVFILNANKSLSISTTNNDQPKSFVRNKTINDEFVVSVGAVVPHRDKIAGLESPYIHSKTLPPWEELEVISERLKHTGKKFHPPFIAIRRTSSPKDNSRIIGTIVNCSEPVAVENHIIVISPKSGKIEQCRELIKRLSDKQVNEFVNFNNRCRHLTVSIVKNIPLENVNDK